MWLSVAKLSEAKKRIRRFWRELSRKDSIFTGRQLEDEVVKFYNHNLEVFPPGFSPTDMIDDAFRNKVLIRRKNRYIII